MDRLPWRLEDSVAGDDGGPRPLDEARGRALLLLSLARWNAS